MFKYLAEAGAAAPVVCRFVFEGRTLEGHVGESVAAAILRSDMPRIRRHSIDGSSRLPFCMMGVCQECVVQVDGEGSRRACLVPVSDGLVIREALSTAGDA
jgi:predicted molibdopterin-dependent oxidoreductase YjgC